MGAIPRINPKIPSCIATGDLKIGWWSDFNVSNNDGGKRDRQVEVRTVGVE